MRMPKHKPYVKLKEALKRRGLSYQDLSRLLNVSITTVCNKITGKSDF